MSPEKLLLFLVMLSVLVVLHEYGHFLLARRNGVRVNDFALGMGPTLLKWTSKRSGTNYRLNLLPIGGYCAMQGEDGKTNEGEQRREFLATADLAQADNFQAKTPLQRLSIVVAGPIANFIVAIVLLFGSAAIFGVADQNPTTLVYQLTPGFPAQQAGLRPGDSIVAINGQAMHDGTQLVHTIYALPNRRIEVTYRRDGREVTIPITTRSVPVDGKPQGRLGFSPMPAMRHATLAESAQFAWYQFSSIVGGTFNVLGHLVTNFAGTASQIQGPIGIAQVSSEVADFGVGAYLSLAAALSISLGIFNLLPIPALDGGRGIFILVEMLRGKPVDPGKEALVHFGGFAALMVVMLAVAYHDIARIVAGKAAF
jgi:regulator of sigma E protease